MKTRAHILVVEDESLLYKRMKDALNASHFSIADYCPSVEAAQKAIQQKRPDLVLLDIELRGELTGLELGKRLRDDYHIPFIYVTDYSDDATFFEGLATHHDHFMVKTKPHLDTKQLLRVIQTVLNKSQVDHFIPKTSILGLTNYLDKLKEGGMNDLTQVPVLYDDICFFTVSPFLESKSEDQRIDSPFINLRTNYLWFLTKDGHKFLLKSSLRDLAGRLPYNFIRINDKYIVNLSPNILQGRINGSRLSIAGHALQIKDTYKDEVKKRFQSIYS